MQLPRKLIGFLLFGCLGIATEIFFTAGSDLFFALKAGESPNLKLQGISYIWMFPIYGSAGIFLPLLLPKFMHLPMYIRLVLYAIGIFTVEFITGWLLDVTTGQCPWHYDHPLSIMGYIHLGYTPFWMLFGLILELVHSFIQSIQSPFIRPDA